MSTALPLPPGLSASELNNLMRALHIDVVALTEILVPRGYRAEMGRHDAPGIHYTLAGKGRVSINGGAFQPLGAHLLIIVPPNTPFTIEVEGDARRLTSIEPHCFQHDPETSFLRVRVPNEPPEVVQICGFFNASFGPAMGLFREASVPIVEQFDPSDRIDDKLREAMAELLQQEVGMGEMTASLLKQVIISLVRRSMASSQTWMERFSILRDHRVARSFAEMAARPGAPHTVESLAHSAGMSRSTFMARFAAVVGRSPMTVLRDLRMRQAALELTTTTTPVELVARNVGYESRSSFVRAFKTAFGEDPTDYRTNVDARSRTSTAGG